MNESVQDIVNVAQTIGCARASITKHIGKSFLKPNYLARALKSVGEKVEFIELYEARRENLEMESSILSVTDLNGYVLDRLCIDYYEQLRLRTLIPDNILDAEGVKKDTEFTAAQKIESN